MVYIEDHLQWVLDEGVYAEYLNSFINQEKVIVYKGHVLLPYSHEEGYVYYLGDFKKVDFCYLNIIKDNSDVIVNNNNILIPPSSSITLNVSNINYSSYKGLYQIIISSTDALFELRVNNRLVDNNENLKKYSFNRENFIINIKNISNINDLNLLDIDIVFDKDTNNRSNKINIDVEGVPGATEMFDIRADQFLNDLDYYNNNNVSNNRLVNNYSLLNDIVLKPSDIGAYKSFVINKATANVDLSTNFEGKNELLLIRSNDDYFNQRILDEGQFKERSYHFSNIDFTNKKIKKLNVIKLDSLDYSITCVESSIVNNELILLIVLSANGKLLGYPKLKLELEYILMD